MARINSNLYLNKKPLLISVKMSNYNMAAILYQSAYPTHQLFRLLQKGKLRKSRLSGKSVFIKHLKSDRLIVGKVR